MNRFFYILISLFFAFNANAQVIADIEKIEKCHTSTGGVQTSFTEFRTVYSTNTNNTFLVIRIDADGNPYTLPGTGTVSDGYCSNGDTIIIQQTQIDSIYASLDSLISLQVTNNNILNDSVFVDTIRKEIIEECLDYITASGDTTKVWAFVNYSTVTGSIIDSGYIDQSTFLTTTVDTSCTPTYTVDTSVVNCEYRIFLRNHLDTTLSTITFDINADETKLNKYGRFLVYDCNDVLKLDITQNSQTTIFMGMQNQDVLTDGQGYIDSIRVTATDNSTIWIPTANGTADLSGPGGTVTGTDLVFNAASPSTMEDALTAVIINYLDSQGYTETTNYIFTVSVTAGGNVSIRFTPKHTPTGTWLGLDKDNKEIHYHTDTGTTSTNTGSSNSTSGGPFSRQYDLPCGNSVRLVTQALLPGELDFTLTKFDSIVHRDPPITYTINNSLSNLRDTCAETRLTANVSGCLTTPVIIWDTGDTSTYIVWDSVSVNTATIDCECFKLEPCCVTLCGGSVTTTSSSTASSDTLCTKIQNITTVEYINGTNTVEIVADSYWSYSFTVIEGSIEIVHNGVTSPFTFSAGYSNNETAFGCDYLKKGIIIVGQTASTKCIIKKIE